MLLKYVYALFIGVLVALFIGVGIAAFYPAPKHPAALSYAPRPMSEPTQEKVSTQSAALFEKERLAWESYQQLEQDYNRDVAVLAIFLALVTLVISIALSKKMLLISNGLLLGAFLTLIYALVRSFGTDNYQFIFLVVSISLALTLVLGYKKRGDLGF